MDYQSSRCNIRWPCLRLPSTPWPLATLGSGNLRVTSGVGPTQEHLWASSSWNLGLSRGLPGDKSRSALEDVEQGTQIFQWSGLGLGLSVMNHSLKVNSGYRKFYNYLQYRDYAE
jgi:hypothetical protein